MSRDRVPQQTRSRETLDRLLDAGAMLLEREEGLPTVHGICDAAGVSVSSFYLRFESREDYFKALLQREFWEPGARALDESWERLSGSDLSIVEIGEHIVAAYVDFVSVNHASAALGHRVIVEMPSLQSFWSAEDATMLRRLHEMVEIMQFPELAHLTERERQQVTETVFLLIVPPVLRAFVEPFGFAKKRRRSPEEITKMISAAVAAYLATVTEMG